MEKKTEKSDPETVPTKENESWHVSPSIILLTWRLCFFCEGKHRWKSAPKTDNLWWLFFGTQWSHKIICERFQPLVGKMIAMNFAPKLEKAHLGKTSYSQPTPPLRLLLTQKSSVGNSRIRTPQHLQFQTQLPRPKALVEFSPPKMIGKGWKRWMVATFGIYVRFLGCICVYIYILPRVDQLPIFEINSSHPPLMMGILIMGI